MGSIKKHMQDEGLTTFVSRNMVFVCPPLCISQTELTDGLKIVERAIAAALKG
jgi:adenosylmethionine-8-amino-7-oxononanoate aminotransferase